MPSILVIDDDDLFRRSTAAALRKRGFETCEAENGRCGVALALSHLPDLVLCDVNMEQMNGYQTLDALRRQPATAGIPFILMTGMGDTAAMRKGMDLGADDYLPKPFTAAQLYSAIDARLNKRDALRQLAEKKLADLRASLTLALPHEMVTPLNGIFGMAQLLVAEAATLSPQEIAEFGQTILTSAQRLQHTVQNFLLFSQLEIQATDPALLEALTSKRTEQVRGIIETRARQHALEAGRAEDLQLDLAEASVAMAPDLFTRIVDELVGNAFKFSSAGQTVNVAGTPENGRFQITVQDHGIGMKPEQVANLSACTQFNRGQREQQGTGLGLAIVRRLVELHGGEFKIRSQPGKGTTASVSLRSGSNTGASGR